MSVSRFVNHVSLIVSEYIEYTYLSTEFSEKSYDPHSLRDLQFDFQVKASFAILGSPFVNFHSWKNFPFLR